MASPLQPISKRAPDERVPLSHGQERLWFLSQLRPSDTAYNLVAAIPIYFNIDVGLLERTLTYLVHRHESLRTRFVSARGTPTQLIGPPWEVRANIVDVQHLKGAACDAEVARIASAEAAFSFDLANGPLLRVSLVRCSATKQVLILSTHHIVSDGWSMTVLEREVAATYQALAQGHEPALAPLRIQYGDFSAWQRHSLRGGALERQLQYWRTQLAGVPLLDLPLDWPRPRIRTGAGERFWIQLGPELRDKVEALSRAGRVTPFMCLLAAFFVLLAKYSGQTDVAIGVPVAGRNRPELENLIGFFVNSLVFRAAVDDNLTFLEFLERVRRLSLDALANQDVPFELIVEELNPARDLGRNPLFQVTFQFMMFPGGSPVAPVEAGELKPEPRAGGVMFDLSLDLWPTAQGIEGRIDYATDVFEAATIERMAKHYRTLLSTVLEQPGRRLGEIELATAEERAVILEKWSPGPRTREPKRPVHRGFEERAARTPDAVAVVANRGSVALSYREANMRANRLARELRRLGAGPDGLVAICSERCAELPIGMLAVLKAGGAYVPVDPQYPRERIAYMFEDSGAEIVLTQRRLADGMPSGRRRVICLDGCGAACGEEENLPDGAGVGDLAYVLYTSGSTGRPKGVAIEHCALANHMTWMQTRFPLSAEDRVLQRTSISFDASVWEFYAPLLAGAPLVIASPERRQDGEDLVREILENRITIVQMVPTLFRLLVDEPDLEACDSLRRVYVGGEALPAETCRRFAKRHRSEIVNLYGPTEATIDSVAHLYRGDVDSRFASVPIGRPVDNMRAYVVDPGGKLIPPGVPGELLLGGAGLARGYWRKPELTNERFTADPFLAGERVYRTGDRVRWLRDGTLQYLGRTETSQVKVRGQRIELGEVEATLLSHPLVTSSAVIHKDGKLIAYAVVTGEREGIAAALRAFLKDRLPEPAVPIAVILLDSLPTAPGGKLDRSALPDVDRALMDLAREYVPPRSNTERTLARIWAELLRLGEVGVHDNFFELGGDSILSIQVVARAKEAGLRLAPKEIFEHQTIAELAEAVQSIDTVEIPLTPVQQWVLEQNGEAAESFRRFELPFECDRQALDEALAALVERHAGLRVSFTRDEDGTLRQTLGGRAIRIATDGSCAIEIHSLAVDTRSCEIVLDEIRELIEAAREGRAARLGAVSQFTDWALESMQAASRYGGEDVAYWAGVVSGFGPMGFHDGANGGGEMIPVDLDATILGEAATALGARLEHALIAALARAIAAWRRKETVQILWQRDARTPETANTVGLMLDLIPLSVRVDLNAPATETLASVKERIASLARNGAGYGRLRWLSADPAVRARLALPKGASISFCHQGNRSGLALYSAARAAPIEVLTGIRDGALRIEWWFESARGLGRGLQNDGLPHVRFVEAMRELSATVRTPSAADFAHARISQADLASLLSRLAGTRAG